jgi:hypothetical protein
MFKPSDFSRCLFNPYTEDLFKSYKQLSVINEISQQVDNKLMKYIIVLYDFNSPIVAKFRDLKVRKQQAAEFCGYDLSKDSMSIIFSLSEDYMLEAVDTFLKKFIHNRTWYMICANESIFWEYGKRMLLPVGNTDEGGKKLSEKDLIAAMQAKTKLSEDMYAIDERLDTAYKRLYGDENIGRFLNKSTTPESIARERSQTNV